MNPYIFEATDQWDDTLTLLEDGDGGIIVAIRSHLQSEQSVRLDPDQVERLRQALQHLR